MSYISLALEIYSSHSFSSMLSFPGTPTESGTKTLEVKVVDADGTSVTKMLGHTIADAV